jgi:hypothetical protein
MYHGSKVIGADRGATPDILVDVSSCMTFIRLRTLIQLPSSGSGDCKNRVLERANHPEVCETSEG